MEKCCMTYWGLSVKETSIPPHVQVFGKDLSQVFGIIDAPMVYSGKFKTFGGDR